MKPSPASVMARPVIAKQPRFESKKLRESAMRQMCTVRTSKCNGDPETTVLAHLPDESHGISRKADDFSACFACSACHDWLDGRIQIEGYSDYDRERMMRRAMVRTWRYWFETGLVKIK